MLHTKLCAPFLFGILAATAASPVGTFEAILKERDHKALAKDVKGYFDAKLNSKGIFEAFAEVNDAIEKTQKKVRDQPLLALVEDWEQVFFYARAEGYDERGVRKGKAQEVTFTDDGGRELLYWLHVPSGYSTRRGGPYPLVIAVHDKDQKPEDHLMESWADPAGIETALVAVPRMPSNSRVWTELNPTGPLDGITTVMTVYNHLLENYSVDMDHVFLAGQGEGVGAALATAQAFPHLFAGVVGRGAAPEGDPANFGHVPTLFLDGGANATGFVERSKELGHENSAHVQGQGEAEVWAWIAANSRDAYPARIEFRPSTPYSTTAYWVNLSGFNIEEKPSIEAAADRATNTITISAENVSTVKVYFNDLLVDMDKPIKVDINGVVHEQLVPRNERVMVDLAFNFGDWGRVFTNVMPFDVSARKE